MTKTNLRTGFPLWLLLLLLIVGLFFLPHHPRRAETTDHTLMVGMVIDSPRPKAETTAADSSLQKARLLLHRLEECQNIIRDKNLGRNEGPFSASEDSWKQLRWWQRHDAQALTELVPKKVTWNELGTTQAHIDSLANE